VNKGLEFRVHEIESQCILKPKHFGLDLIESKFLNGPVKKLEQLLHIYNFKSFTKEVLTLWQEMLSTSAVILPKQINSDFLLHVVPDDK